MPHKVNWDDFRLIQMIAEAGSLGGAADELGLNHSTVFRRLGALEESLGRKLFERSRNGYAPTSTGEEMVALARRMADDVIDFERKVVGSDVKPSGDLRVATNDSMIVYLLSPIMAGFLKAYPDIHVEVIVGNQALNLSRRDADIAIRATDSPPETLVGRRIAALAWSCYGSAALQDAWPEPHSAGAPWIGYGDKLGNLPAFRTMMERVGDGRIIYRTSSVIGQAEAVATGIGFGFMPCFVGDHYPGLTRICEPEIVGGRDLWMLTHPDLRQAARVRAFMEYVGAELHKLKRRFEGG